MKNFRDPRSVMAKPDNWTGSVPLNSVPIEPVL